MTPDKLLIKGLTELGLSCTDVQTDAFMTLLSELKKWNKAYNLTALKTDDDIIIKHFLDSVLYLKAIGESVKGQINNIENVIPAEAGIQRSSSLLDSRLRGNDHLEYLQYSQLSIADAGSGAGFPGIPIKIIRPEIKITLIESSRKKTAFLRHIIRLLKLENISVLEQRVENLGAEYRKAFDIIVSRATFKVTDFLKTAYPYVKDNGRLVLSKGPGALEEIEGIEAVQKIMKLKLPLAGDERNLIILKC
ncbi:MAG: 16S rRNA (guanine(527)-N(7))-methyltransferase RsmG [Nitrospirae bacterium]|nr:16S rRNA (guanine(527)-N(7))-methyltransferase RsmG [Nitrospirota bacterium]